MEGAARLVEPMLVQLVPPIVLESGNHLVSSIILHRFIFPGSSTAFVGSIRPSGYSPPPPARTLNFGKSPASIGNFVSSLSQSLSTKSKKRHVTTEHDKKPGVRHKRDADAKQEDAGDDGNEADMLPVTDGAHSLGSLTVEDRRATEQRAAAVVEVHRQEFMRRALAMMTMVRPQSYLEYIANVVQYGQPGVKIREMEPGYERNRLRDFRRNNKNGFKYMKQYCLEDFHSS